MDNWCSMDVQLDRCAPQLWSVPRIPCDRPPTVERWSKYRASTRVELGNSFVKVQFALSPLDLPVLRLAVTCGTGGSWHMEVRVPVYATGTYALVHGLISEEILREQGEQGRHGRQYRG
jgi:hypothetical protein